MKKRVGFELMLRGGDRRSLGEANHVAAVVARHPKRFGELMACLWSEDALVRMRAADAVEKITKSKPEMLGPYKRELLGLADETTQIELRWHLALMMPRLELAGVERERAIGSLWNFLEDKSAIVKVCALEGLAEMARGEARLEEDIVNLLEECSRAESAAVRARSRKLLGAMRKKRRG